MVGKTLGHYEILELLGSGGMGEVYLGEDTRLGRKVAIKVLPAEFASDPERLARFEQEARAAAALNHPHIAVVHDVGSEQDEDGTITHFMVQEYLEGQSLRERLDEGALPLDKALDLATEVGEALIAAHKAGIIHRDLKPDNIFVTEEGHAKVLDFGLAKLTEMAAPTGGSASMSPTMLGTVAGQVMGTAGYMAPEQVQGEEVDHRADLFAFGCVLYGMVTGRQAFSGKNVHETLGKILSDEPPSIAEIDASLPAEIHRIIRKSLAKAPGKRYQTAGDLVVDLQTLHADVDAGTALSMSGGAPSVAAPVEAQRGIPARAAIPVALLIGLAGALGGWALTNQGPPAQPVQRFTVEFPEAGPMPSGGGHSVVISPDGRNLVYRDAAQLYLRPLDQLEARPIPGTENGRRPFFSPDGQWLGFHSGTTLKKVSLEGGAPFDLCPAGGFPYATWGINHTIIFVRGNSLYQVPDTGGEPQLVIEPDPEKGQLSFYRPEFLPSGRAVLAELQLEDRDTRSIAVISLETGEVSIVADEGSDPAYASTGHVVYARGSTMFAVPFDAERLEVQGQPTPVVQGVRVEGGGAAQFSFSREGLLAYAPSSELAGNALVWVDRGGATQPATENRRPFEAPRLSPDGRRVAATIVGENRDIWIIDLAQGTQQRFTTMEGAEYYPAWSPDGTRVIFSSTTRLFSRSADGTGEPEVLSAGENNVFSGTFSPDERFVVFRENGPNGRDLLMLSVQDGTVTSLLSTPFAEHSPALSPDGKWLAFTSDVSGGSEIYVQPFPGLGGAVPISTDGGTEPAWGPSPEGELFYIDRNLQMVAVTLRTEPEFTIVSRATLFSTEGYVRNNVHTNYDVDLNGQKFLMIQAEGDEGDRSRINVVLNWFEELKQRVSTGGR